MSYQNQQIYQSYVFTFANINLKMAPDKQAGIYN